MDIDDLDLAIAEQLHAILLGIGGEAAGPAQLVVSYAPPGGVKQTIGPTLLRAVSGLMSGLTDAHGNFTITAPVWLDQIEAIATVSHASGMQSGLSPAARTGVSSLGLIHLAPGVNF